MIQNDTSLNEAIKKLSNLFIIPAQERSQLHLEEIMHHTKNTKFLQKITEERSSDRIHWECCRAMTLEVYQKGECVINFGEVGDKFYIIIKGKVSITIPSKTKKKNLTLSDCRLTSLVKQKSFVAGSNEPAITRKNTQVDINFLEKIGEIEEYSEIKVLSDGDSFGELALLSDTPRSATVRCKETSCFAVLSQKDYKKILRGDAVKSIRERVDFLRKLQIFEELSENNLRQLAYMLSEKSFRKQQVLYSENSSVDNIYFIKSGEFSMKVKTQLAHSKFIDPSSLLKLKLMKNPKKMVSLPMFIKGRGQVFGHEEFIEEKLARDHSCTCISNFGCVYFVNINVKLI